MCGLNMLAIMPAMCVSSRRRQTRCALVTGVQTCALPICLPGDPDDTHSRYIEAEVNGSVIASIYLPNGNPQPGPKFDYKLAWFDRLIAHAGELLALERPVVLAGDYNVCPEDRDAFSITAMANDALVQPESRAAFRRLIYQGWIDALRQIHPLDDKLRSEEHTSELQSLMRI